MAEKYKLILAKNGTEASTYGRRMGFKSGTYRCVAAAKSVRGIQVAECHVLPGFNDRVDRHAIKSALRWGRDITFVDVVMPPAPVVDQVDGMGPQLFMDLNDVPTPATKHRSFDPVVEIVKPPSLTEAQAAQLLEHVDEIPVLKSDPAPGVMPLEQPARKRKSRCKICGRMTLGPDGEGHDEAKHKTELFG